MNRWTVLASIAVVALVAGLAPTANAATTTDVILLVDESGSMGAEHAWIPGMVQSLEADLNAAGIVNNRYGVVGFASPGHASGEYPHTHTLSGAAWGVASDITTNMSPAFALDGGTEDGWAAIQYAIANYSFRQEKTQTGM